MPTTNYRKNRRRNQIQPNSENNKVYNPNFQHSKNKTTEERKAEIQFNESKNIIEARKVKAIIELWKLEPDFEDAQSIKIRNGKIRFELKIKYRHVRVKDRHVRVKDRHVRVKCSNVVFAGVFLRNCDCYS